MLSRRTGALAHDAAQELAAEKLQSLQKALKNYQPSEKAGGWRERLGLARRREADAPQGLYIFGPVGRGKSMLMDLFFATAPIERKRRVHFHAFMLEVQETLHRWRQEKDAKDDVIAALADKIAGEATLLCFDEFHVSNIADAMILGRLFEALFDRGVVVVATSNWEPDDLYQGGLQRDRFLPFIALIKDKLDVLELDAARDYRLQRIKDMRVYFHPLGDLAATPYDGELRAPDRRRRAAPRSSDRAGAAPRCAAPGRGCRVVRLRRTVRPAARRRRLSRNRDAFQHCVNRLRANLVAGSA